MAGKLMADKRERPRQDARQGTAHRFKIMREGIAVTAREPRDAAGHAVLGT
jgi:hypothetical protein